MNTISKAILMALVIVLPGTIGYSQGKNEKIDSLMKKIHRSGQFDGAVLVADQQGIRYKNGFGMATISPNTPNAYTNTFYIASISKPFTAILVMQLVEAKKMELTNTIGDYFPAVRNEAVKKVSIHQLLSHTSGIPEFLDATIASEKMYTDQWFTDKLNSVTLDSIAGNFKYINSTYVLLAHVIEKVSGKSYAENLTNNILKKASMKSSGSLATGDKIKNLAIGHRVKDSTIENAPFLNPAIFQGAGSIYSTVEDLYRFDQALYSDGLMNDQSKEKMFTAQSAAPYGYGWSTRKLPIGRVVYHEGDLSGYTCIFFRAIEKKYCIILLSNNQSNDRYKLDIVKNIASILYEDENKN